MSRTTRRGKVLFYVRKTDAETVPIFRTAYGDSALSQPRVYDWFVRFNREQMSIEDQPRSGRPSTSRADSNIEKTNTLTVKIGAELWNNPVNSLDYHGVKY